jgi:chloride channel 7
MSGFCLLVAPAAAAMCAAGAAAAAGVITAAAAFAVNLGVENISGFKFWATLTLLERGHAFASYLVYVLINCTLIVGSVFITMYFAPAAAGSGIAEVKVGPLEKQQQ